jgi:hypothetical protein
VLPLNLFHTFGIWATALHMRQCGGTEWVCWTADRRRLRDRTEHAQYSTGHHRNGRPYATALAAAGGGWSATAPLRMRAHSEAAGFRLAGGGLSELTGGEHHGVQPPTRLLPDLAACACRDHGVHSLAIRRTVGRVKAAP